MFNYGVDLLCEKCGLKWTDFIPKKEGDWHPKCPKCRYEFMVIHNTAPRMNLKSSDLPGSNWAGYNPAFGKNFNSKRETFQALKEFNQKEKDKAIDNKMPFREFEWIPTESTHDKELRQMKEELGQEAFNAEMKKEHNAALDKRLDEKLEQLWPELNI